MKLSSTRLLWYWGPAAAWVGAVAVFSSGSFGSSNTSWVLARLLAMLHIHLTPAHFNLLHAVIRKSAHFISYGTLSWLFFRALRGTARNHGKWQPAWALLALGVCLLAASADEFHQFFTPGRTGSWKDVVLDMVGALFAQSVLIVLSASSRGQNGGAGQRQRGSGDGRRHSSSESAALSMSTIRQPQYEDSAL